jgi:hypothetical protein
MKPAPERNPLQQLNLIVPFLQRRIFPTVRETELEAAVAELLLGVARAWMAWMEPRQGDSDESKNHR